MNNVKHLTPTHLADEEEPCTGTSHHAPVGRPIGLHLAGSGLDLLGCPGWGRFFLTDTTGKPTPKPRP